MKYLGMVLMVIFVLCAALFLYYNTAQIGRFQLSRSGGIGGSTFRIDTKTGSVWTYEWDKPGDVGRFVPVAVANKSRLLNDLELRTDPNH